MQKRSKNKPHIKEKFRFRFHFFLGVNKPQGCIYIERKRKCYLVFRTIQYKYHIEIFKKLKRWSTIILIVQFLVCYDVKYILQNFIIPLAETSV